SAIRVSKILHALIRSPFCAPPYWRSSDRRDFRRVLFGSRKMKMELSTKFAQTNLAQVTSSSRTDVPQCRVASSGPPLGAVDVADGRRLPVPRIRGGLPPGVLRRVREYIDAHLDETISIKSLAGVAGLSKFHFARAFKQSEGVTPHEFLIRCRVKRAK